MAIFCSHCGTQLEDYMKFCYSCGNPPKDAPATSTKSVPKVEYKSVHLDLSQEPYIQYATPYSSRPDLPTNPTEKASAEMVARQRIMDLLTPYFNDGWEFDGTFNSAVNMLWVSKGNWSVKGRLTEAAVQLRRNK